MADQDRFETVDGQQKAPVALIIAGVIVIAIAIFVAQNTEEIGFDFLMFTFNAPLWLVLVIVFALGALAGQGFVWVRRRRKRRDRD